jgi:hypothetical protein
VAEKAASSLEKTGRGGESSTHFERDGDSVESVAETAASSQEQA